jgi:hypothetical protein
MTSTARAIDGRFTISGLHGKFPCVMSNGSRTSTLSPGTSAAPGRGMKTIGLVIVLLIGASFWACDDTTPAHSAQNPSASSSASSDNAPQQTEGSGRVRQFSP